MMENQTSRVVRVCFVCPKAYPVFNSSVKEVFGGSEVDLYYLGTELAKDEDFDVSFIVADYGQADVETIENVTVIKSLDFAKNALAGAIRIWRALKRANADIYTIKTASVGVPMVAAFCRLNKKVFIYRTAHQDECDGTYLRNHKFVGHLFAASLRGAKIVFSQSASDKEKLKFTIAVDSQVIPNGHRLSEPISCQRDSILWVGRSAGFKRPQLFLDLAEKFPNEKFVMICQKATEDNHYDELLDRAENISNLEFHQRVGFNEIAKYFQMAKIFVNTSLAEGFPNTFIQACMQSTAIVSLNVDPDDFLQRYSCGISCRDDIAKLNEAVTVMLDSQRHIDIGRNGRKYVEENHDIAKIIEQYKTVFREFR
jgi:glycosyltransferase involved in cell wall biosynthesis